MPLPPEAVFLDLDPTDGSEPDVWCRPAPIADDLEAPEADALEQAQVVVDDEDGERR